MMIELLAAAAMAGMSAPERKVAECTVAAAIELGRDNSEPVDVVIRGAEARCHNEWARIRDAWFWQRRAGSFLVPAKSERELNDYIFLKAFEALMKARSAR